MIFSESVGKNDALYGNWQTPIRMLLEANEEACKQNSIAEKLFAHEKSNGFAETYTSLTALEGFDPVGENGAYPQEEVQEGHTKIIENMTWKDSFAVSREMIDDNKIGAFKSQPEGFIKDSSKWVIFPRLSYNAHIHIEERNAELSRVFSEYERNIITEAGDKDCRRGIATHGISYTYTMEALRGKSAPRVFKVSTPFPFPEQAAVKFLEGLDEVLCIEELDPVIERELTYVCGKYHLNTKIRGKLTGDVQTAGENTCDSVYCCIAEFFLYAEQLVIFSYAL